MTGQAPNRAWHVSPDPTERIRIVMDTNRAAAPNCAWPRGPAVDRIYLRVRRSWLSVNTLDEWQRRAQHVLPECGRGAPGRRVINEIGQMLAAFRLNLRLLSTSRWWSELFSFTHHLGLMVRRRSEIGISSSPRRQPPPDPGRIPREAVVHRNLSVALLVFPGPHYGPQWRGTADGTHHGSSFVGNQPPGIDRF